MSKPPGPFTGTLPTKPKNIYEAPADAEIPRPKEYGVASRAKGRKRWLQPNDYGRILDAKQELADLQDDKHYEHAIVWRFARSQWYEYEKGSME